jgi:hypothetical protein
MSPAGEGAIRVEGHKSKRGRKPNGGMKTTLLKRILSEEEI